MVIDILFLLTLIWAVVKGWSKGFIVAIFSLVALVFGLAAAIKLSTGIGAYFQNLSGRPSMLWPVLAFILIFILVAFIVRILAKILQKALKIVMLGWLNRVVGVIFYILAYTIVFSVLLWIADQLGFIPYAAKIKSMTYNHIAIIGPRAIHDIAGWIPWFQDIFHQLKEFFGEISPLK